MEVEIVGRGPGVGKVGRRRLSVGCMKIISR